MLCILIQAIKWNRYRINRFFLPRSLCVFVCVIKYQLYSVCNIFALENTIYPETLFSPRKKNPVCFLARSSRGTGCYVLIFVVEREREKHRLVFLFVRFYLERMSATCYATDFISFHFIL